MAVTKTTRAKSSSVAQAPADRTKAYALDVVAGRIVAGPHVRNACRRHLQDLIQGPERGLFFDHEAADYAFRYFENVLMLSEGQFEGRKFELHPSQAFIIGSLFGWKGPDGLRRFRRAYIEQGKGNGKSPLAGGLGLLGMTAAGEAGAQIYAAAAKKDQAGILFADAVKMVKKSPLLAMRVEFAGGEGREFSMAHHASASFFRPVSRDTGRTGSGPRPFFVLVDEVHELPDRRVIEMLERGFKFRREPLLFMITNSGSDRTSVCWEEHEHAVKVAAGHTEAVNDPTFVGDVIDDRTFSYVCSLDDGDDPLEDPSCWAKANPLLGVTITKQYLADVVAQAKAIPGSLNGILRLHFCVWTDAETAWMTRPTLEPALADFDPRMHEGRKVYLGLDLSQVRDITAMAAVVETGTVPVEVEVEGEKLIIEKPTFDAWIEAWTPGDTLDQRQLQDKLPYRTWVNGGHLHAPQGQAINFRHVAQVMAEYDNRYDVQLVAYDRYAFRRFEEEVNDIGLSVTFAEHPQGGCKKGKPLEAAVEAAEQSGQPAPEGMWMPGSLRLLEEALLEGRLRLRRNPVLVSAIMSAVIESDRWGNSWLSKARSANKIDAAVALCMAIGAAHAMPQDSGGIDDYLENGFFGLIG